MNRSSRFSTVLFACFVASAFAAGHATADTIGMDYTGLGLGSATGGYTVNYWDHDAAAMTSKSVGGAGQMKFTITSSYGPYSTGDTVRLFCSDVYDWVHGSPANYDVVPLASAPNSPDEGPVGGMGADHAALINHLYSNYYSISGTDHVHASAFQLAVWELGNESLTHAAAEGFSISDSGEVTDRFFVNGTPDENGTLKQQAMFLANTWLAEITADWDDGNGTLDDDYALAGAVLENYQDMILIVPLPKALWVMAFGLPSILILRRYKGVVGI